MTPKRLFFFSALAVVALVGFGLGASLWKKAPAFTVERIPGIHPETEVLTTEFKPFALLLYAHNDAPWCERALRSIFEQDYEHLRLFIVDDGSQDGTFELVQQQVLKNAQEHRTILIRNEAPIGLNASLQSALAQCLDREVVLPLSMRDWLAKPNALSTLNLAFQNPDVWVGLAAALRYPSYEIKENGICCFYSALFKQIHPENVSAYPLALQQLAGGRMRTIKEPLAFANETLGLKFVGLNEGSGELVSQKAKPLEKFP